MYVLGNKTLFSGPESPWHGSACVRTVQLCHHQNRWLHPNSLQGPRLMPACTLARHGTGCADLTCTKDLSDNLVADHRLVLRPWFWPHFALCCRLKPQALHGEICSGVKGGSMSDCPLSHLLRETLLILEVHGQTSARRGFLPFFANSAFKNQWLPPFTVCRSCD